MHRRGGPVSRYDRYDVTDEQWEGLAQVVPLRSRNEWPSRVDHRTVPDEPVAEQHSATDADGAELESDVDVPAQDAVPPASDGESGAPRPRRRRGRVVAPAGPPRITSTEA